MSDGRTKVINIRLTAEERAELEAVARPFAPLATTHAVARRALTLGLAALRADPSQLLPTVTPRST